MNARGPRYSQDEDKVILECVKNYPYNLTNAFKVAHESLPNRSVNSIAGRWHNYLKHKEETRANIAFMSISRKNIYSNRKVIRDGSKAPEPIKKGIWSRIMNILFKSK